MLLYTVVVKPAFVMVIEYVPLLSAPKYAAPHELVLTVLEKPVFAMVTEAPETFVFTLSRTDTRMAFVVTGPR